MKWRTTLISIGIIAVCSVGIHFAFLVRWDGSRDIDLIIEPDSMRSQIAHVRYWSSSYTSLEHISTLDSSLEKAFPRSSLVDASLSEGGKYQITASGSGEKSFLWTHYEYWHDGVVIRIELHDGRVFTSLHQMDSKINRQLRIQL
jgi:hypothetical protein